MLMGYANTKLYGFKGTGKFKRCRDKFYLLPKTYKMKGHPHLCYRGFHFCEKLKNVDQFYSFSNPNNNFYAVEIPQYSYINETITKSATNQIRFRNKLTEKDFLENGIVRKVKRVGKYTYVCVKYDNQFIMTAYREKQLIRYETENNIILTNTKTNSFGHPQKIIEKSRNRVTFNNEKEHLSICYSDNMYHNSGSCIFYAVDKEIDEGKFKDFHKLYPYNQLRPLTRASLNYLKLINTKFEGENLNIQEVFDVYFKY